MLIVIRKYNNPTPETVSLKTKIKGANRIEIGAYYA